MESLRFPCLLESGDCVSFPKGKILVGSWADGVCDPEPGRTKSHYGLFSGYDSQAALGVQVPGEDRVGPGMKP